MDKDTLIWILSGLITIIGGIILWLTKHVFGVDKKQSEKIEEVKNKLERGSINTIKEDSELKEKVSVMRTELDYIKKESDKMTTKIDGLADQFNTLNNTVLKSIIETKQNRDNIIDIKEKIGNIDARIEILTNAFNEYILKGEK